MHVGLWSAAASAIDERAGQDTAAQVRSAWAEFQNDLDRFVEHLPIIGVAVGVVVVAIVLGKLVSRWQGPFRLLSPNALVRTVLQNIIATLIVLAGLLIALELLNATKLVGTLLGAAGVVGLALGFAFRDIVENYLASILLAVRRPFESRDLVKIGEHLGKVMSLTTRATVLMTEDGNHLRLPNAQVFKAVITNYTRNPKRRFEFSVGAGTEEDLFAAQALGVTTLQETPGVMNDPAPFALVDALGDSTVSISFYAWVDQREFSFLRVRSAAILRVKVAFDDAEIQMPEPTYRVAMLDTSQPRSLKQKSEERAMDVVPQEVARVADDLDKQITAEQDRDPEGANLLID